MTSRSGRKWLAIGIALGLIALGRYAWLTRTEPHFVDESAYLAQSFYWDLFRTNDRDSWLWLAYDAQDLPPLTKYLVGMSLELRGFRPPGPGSSREWYGNIETRVGTDVELFAGRLPIPLFGALGVVAAFALGTVAFSTRVGVLGALLLFFNPLYSLHAARAMSDVPAESLLVASVACGLWAWKSSWRDGPGRGWWLGTLGAGVFAGLAILSKLNGMLALFALGAIGASALCLARAGGGDEETGGRGWGWLARIGSLAGLGIAAVVAVALFVALNPFVTAHPKGRPPPGMIVVADPGESWGARLERVIRHRTDVSKKAAEDFPHNAVDTLPEKAATLFVQGWGRFGPFGPRWSDSTRWLDPAQDWGMLPWGVVVFAGAVAAVLIGKGQRSRGDFPAAWGFLLYAALAYLVVGLFIPLAWDRYLMSIQPPTAILGGVALDGAIRWVRGRRDDA